MNVDKITLGDLDDDIEFFSCLLMVPLALFLISYLNMLGNFSLLHKRNMFKRKNEEKISCKREEMVSILSISIHLLKFPFLQIYSGKFYNET